MNLNTEVLQVLLARVVLIMSKFQVDDIVIVDNPKLKSNGLVGKIIKMQTEYLAIVSFNYLPWCKTNDILGINIINLKQCNKERNEVTNMVSKRTLGIRADEPFKVVKVRFFEGNNVDRCYSYASFIDVEAGDTVAVKSANHGWGIADVVEVVEHPTEADIAFVCEGREIINTVDKNDFYARVKARQQREADEKQKAALKQQMRKMAMEDNEIALFARIAETNPEMKALLDQFNSIDNKNVTDKNENKV